MTPGIWQNERGVTVHIRMGATVQIRMGATDKLLSRSRSHVKVLSGDVIPLILLIWRLATSVALLLVGRPASTRLVFNGVNSGHCPHMYPPLPISADTQCSGFSIPIAVVISLAFVALTRQRGNAGTLELWAASAWPLYNGYILDMWEATA